MVNLSYSWCYESIVSIYVSYCTPSIKPFGFSLLAPKLSRRSRSVGDGRPQCLVTLLFLNRVSLQKIIYFRFFPIARN